jgi:uncharacterized protein YfaT (DUF1175 family)
MKSLPFVAAGLVLVLPALLIPLRHQATLEVAAGNPVQHLRVESRNLLGLKLAPWGLALDGCASWGGGGSGVFFAPDHPGEVNLRIWPSFHQSFSIAPSSDGTERDPLRDEGEREAFRTWFVALLEQQLQAPSPAWEPSQRDCAGLLRFAFREAWASHDEAWRERVAFSQPFQGRSPKPGVWKGVFLTDEGWQPFARGSQLRVHNCVLLGRDISLARPGDLVFFSRPGARSAPDHAMAFVRPDSDGMPMLLYHTGPELHGRTRAVAGEEGEVRRVRCDELMQHPNPEFRPHPDNPAFLGVYRWRVLAEESL